ncbi:MAG: orotate phosphoribosyltransferase [Hyphomicrobiales bacterium]
MGASVEADRVTLKEIIARKSFGRGKITLSSGRESDFYFDLKPSMLDPVGASVIAKQILSEVVRVGGEFVGGLEMGAVPITGAVCQYSAQNHTPVLGFFVRKKPKEHGAKKVIEGLPPHENLKGRRVVIVEDVTTSGDSALRAVQACEAEGAEVVLVVSIVDREEGATQAFADRGISFKSLYRASEFLHAS